MIYFFFSSRRRHTRLQGDWSSDVCSSDLFVVVQAAGTLRGSTRWLRRIGWLSDRPLEALGQINDELAHFYRREPGRLTLSILYHFLAWLIGVLEPWLILRWIGLPVSLA